MKNKDLVCNVEPLFKSIIMNEDSEKNLLINSLPLDENMNIMIEGKKNDIIIKEDNKPEKDEEFDKVIRKLKENDNNEQWELLKGIDEYKLKKENIKEEEKMYSVLKDMKVNSMPFDELLIQVKEKVDENMKRGLSSQICFSALLHICNEYNTLVLKTCEEDNKIIIEKITLNK